MPIPTTDGPIADALLEFLNECGGEASAAKVADEVAKKLKLSDRELLRTRPPAKGRESGESFWRHRLRQVKFALVRTGKLEPASQSGRGVWRLAK